MNLQSKALDPVLGIHVHMLVYPGAPPVIAPGVVLSIGLVSPDLAGMIVGYVCELFGFPQPDTRVVVHGLEAAATGSDVLMVHAQPIGGPMVPTEKVKGDSKLYFGTADVLIDGAYAVRLGEIGMGCCTISRIPFDVVTALQFDVFSGGPPQLDVGAVASDLVDGLVEQLGIGLGAGEVLRQALEIVWNCHEEILAFVEDPSEENAGALARKLGEEIVDAAVGAAIGAILEATLGPLVKVTSMRDLARQRPRRWRPRRDIARAIR